MLNSIIKKFEKNLELKKQEKQNIEKFFSEELKCKFVPHGVIEFYKEYDGCELSINNIFSLEEISNEIKEFFCDFLEGMGINTDKYKYIPIANDGMGGYYAFLANRKEETIYYLDHEFPDERMTYNNFEEFLKYNCLLDLGLQ